MSLGSTGFTRSTRSVEEKENGIYSRRQLILRRSNFRFLLQKAQDDFAGLHVNNRKHLRANGAEPIVNDIVKVFGSVGDNGHFIFNQVEAKEPAADAIIEAGAASPVGTFRNHFVTLMTCEPWGSDLGYAIA